jgi:hypothetical protein
MKIEKWLAVGIALSLLGITVLTNGEDTLPIPPSATEGPGLSESALDGIEKKNDRIKDGKEAKEGEIKSKKKEINSKKEAKKKEIRTKKQEKKEEIKGKEEAKRKAADRMKEKVDEVESAVPEAKNDLN